VKLCDGRILTEGVSEHGLRKICEFKEEVTAGWRKTHNEELHKFHSLPIIIISKTALLEP
jgi:hypothetical protein